MSSNRKRDISGAVAAFLLLQPELTKRFVNQYHGEDLSEFIPRPTYVQTSPSKLMLRDKITIVCH